MNFKIYTFGCKVNQYESEQMRELLEEKGFKCTENDADAEIFIVNSCTVTAISEGKCRRFLGRIRRKFPQSIIVLTGCMSQAFPRKYENFEVCDVVTGNTSRHLAIELLEDFIKNRNKIVDIPEHDRKCGEFEESCVSDFSERTRAYLKIEDGCDRFCSYCVIPYARGRVRSKPLSDIRREVEALSEKGYTEIVLVGINLSKYGTDIGLSLCDAVETVAESSGVKRIRLGSLEPELLTPDILLRLSKVKEFCPQFHLSLQSGCDETLKRMNRHYNSAEYREIVENIRALFHNPSFTTDVMVGFPGEDEEEFSKSLSFVSDLGFAKVHVFPYSRRSGTVADRMPDQLTKSIKYSRVAVMTAETELRRIDFMKTQLGMVTEVLFERMFDEDYCEGYSINYIPVKVKGSSDLCHKIKSVRLLSIEGDYLIGELIENA